MTIYDQTNDPGLQLGLQILSKYPEAHKFIMESDVTSDTSDYPPHMFLIPGTRTFPTGTPEDIVLSRAYFVHQKNKFNPQEAEKIERKIRAFMEYHSVPEDMFTELEKTGGETSASENLPEFYLLPDDSLCRVSTPGEMEKAAALFENEYQTLPLPKREAFARNFMKAAKEISGVSASPLILKYAARMDMDPEIASELLDHRIGFAVHHGKNPEPYYKLASIIKGGGVWSNADMRKLASSITKADEATGLDVDSDIFTGEMCPFAVVFNSAPDSIEKQAETVSLTDITGTYGPQAEDAMAFLSPQDVEQIVEEY